MITNTQIHYADRNRYNSNPGFKGAETVVIEGLRFLNNSPAIGACAVDLGSMVIPRTAVDMKKRGVDAGTETAIREGSSTTNHLLVGMVGLGAATIVSQGINRGYGVKANRIFANNDSIDVFSSFWNNDIKDVTKARTEYYTSILKKLKGLNGTARGVEMPDAIIDGVAEKLSKYELLKDYTKKLSKQERKDLKDLKRSIVADAVKTTGAEGTFEISVGNKTVKDSISVLIENMTALGKAFASKGVENLGEFTKDLKKIKTASALLGLATTCTIGCSIQPLNTYLTKKRTGKEGFVGVEGREADKSAGFKVMKAGAAAVMGLLAFSSISRKPSEILNKIQFSSMLPNINQFKMIYGMTIMSRFLSARDKNELRESTIKDSLGFANWLILGGFVSKLIARILPDGKSLMNNPVVNKGKGRLEYAWKWITQSSIKTYDQILLKELADAKKEIVGVDGKTLGFRQLMEKAKGVEGLRGKVGKLALAQIAGYLYSGVILGFGIARLNIFITGKVQKSQKTNQQKQSNSSDAKVMFFAQNNDDKKSIFTKIKAWQGL